MVGEIQLRSALAVRIVEPEELELSEAAIEPDEPLLPDIVPDALEPELMVPDEPAVDAAPLPVVEPCAADPVALPPGVPVVPIGVFCVLVWPLPTAGLLAGVGGVPCANARLKVAAVTAAMTILSDMVELLGLLDLDLPGKNLPENQG